MAPAVASTPAGALVAASTSRFAANSPSSAATTEDLEEGELSARDGATPPTCVTLSCMEEGGSTGGSSVSCRSCSKVAPVQNSQGNSPPPFPRRIASGKSHEWGQAGDAKKGVGGGAASEGSSWLAYLWQRRDWQRVVAQFGLYIATGRIAFLLTSKGVSWWYPGNGVAVVLLNSATSRPEFCLQLLVIVPAYFLARISVGLTDWPTLCWLAAANMLEILIGTLSMRSLLPVSQPLAMVKSIRFMVVAVGFFTLLGSAVAATVASFAIVRFFGADYGETWTVWFFADMSAGYSTLYLIYNLMAYVPTMFWLEDLKALYSGSRSHIEKLLEYTLLAAVLALVFIFDSGGRGPDFFTTPLWLLPLPVVAWIAMRYHQLYAAFMDSWLLAVLVTAAILDRGPLSTLATDHDSQVSVYATLHLLVFMTTITADFVSIWKIQTQDREMLQKAEMEARFRIVQHVSHEFRTPLSIMLGFAEQVMLRERLSGEGLEDMQHVISAAKGMNDLVDDLLDTFRLDVALYPDLPQDTVVMGCLARDVEGMLCALAAEKDISLTVDCLANAEGERVLVPLRPLTKIIMNLGSNAIKYTPSGGYVAIDLSVGPLASHVPLATREAGLALCVQVADSGIGIAKEEQGHIFEEFYRCRGIPTSMQGVKGTGLGLAIVKKTVDLMGGTISLESSQGKGCVFTVMLPVYAAPLSPDLVPISGLSSCEDMMNCGTTKSARLSSLLDAGVDKLSKEGGKRGSVLIVDDSSLNAKLLSRIMGQLDFSTECASSGEEAVRLMEEMRDNGTGKPHYCLVMLDLGLPIMTGGDVLNWMRSQDGWLARVPVVVISANNPDNALIEQGCNGFLPKPFTFSETSRVIQELTPSSPSTVSSRTTHLT